MMDSASTNLGISERGQDAAQEEHQQKQPYEKEKEEELVRPTFTIDDDVIIKDDCDEYEYDLEKQKDGLFKIDDEPEGVVDFDDLGDMYEDPYQETPKYNDVDASEAEELDDVDIHGNEHENNQQQHVVDSYDPKEESRVHAFLSRYNKALGVCTIGLCFSVFLVALIIAVSYDESDPPPHNAAYGFSPWGQMKAADKVPPFQPPPLSIQEVCTQEFIATNSGFQQCQDICNGGQCCRFDPVAAPDQSCERGHAEECTTYHHYCEHPPSAKLLEFQRPPVNLKDVCTAEVVATPDGMAACAEACQGGQCCNFPTSLEDLSCLRGHETECQTYHRYCENPPPAEQQQQQQQQQMFPFQKAPDDIDQTCSPEEISKSAGFHACEDVCSGGTCCRFDPDTEPHLSCRTEQAFDCPIYDQYCGGGPGSPEDQQSSMGSTQEGDLVPTYVEQVCSDHSLATLAGFLECEVVCDKQSCCWDKESDPCSPEEQVSCVHYSHCLAMEASDHMDVAIQAFITLRCSDDSIQTASGRKSCLLSCAQAACCFSSEAGECPHDNDSFCNQYSACEKVIEDSIPPAPTTLSDHCSPNNIDNIIQNMAACEQACDHAPCCWGKDGMDSCAASNPMCEEYQPCSVLEQIDSSGSSNNNGNGNGNDSQIILPTPPSFLKDACTEKKVTNIEGAILCRDACHPAECCWDKEVVSCEENALCQGYEPCDVLNDASVGIDENGVPFANINSSGGGSEGTQAPTPQIDAVPDYLNTVCKYESGGDEIHDHMCVRECQNAECCWNENSTNPCTNSANCTGYDICKDMNFTQLLLGPHNDYQEAPDSPTHPIAPEDTLAPASSTAAPQQEAPVYTAVMIEDACLNHDNSIVNLCAKICEGSDCCFEGDNGGQGNTCDVDCQKYSACAVLRPTDDSLDQICNTSVLDRSDCVAACGAGACCFTTDPTKACAEQSPGTICSQYEPCELLYGG